MSIKEILAKSKLIKKDGTEVLNPSTALEGKKLGIYFSAKWCPPCCRFTPKLAQKYSEILSSISNFEIIFISCDRDEESAKNYYAEMPWLMLSFSDEETKDALDKVFEVNSIPSLILLKEDMTIITKEGTDAIITIPFDKIENFEDEKRALEEKKAAELAELKRNFSWSTVFGEISIKDADGNSVSPSSLEGKIVGLYFSAHWCPPCRAFTPLLAEKYTELIKAEKKFEIIFISSDKDEHTAEEYFAHMPWKMLDYSLREKKQLLSEIFEIQGIPSLVLLDENATLLTLNGRDAIMQFEFEKIKDYEAEQVRLAAELNAKCKIMPETFYDPELHEHPLKKLESVYSGSYGCDVCGSGGHGWVYHCDECGFDAHPTCVKLDNHLEVPSVFTSVQNNS